MEEYTEIIVSLNPDGKLDVTNPTRFPLISKGRHGALFNLLDGRCVKIYPNTEYAKIESEAYIRGMGSDILPRLYEIGSNYILMEYVDGMDLKEYIRKYRNLSDRLAENIILMFIEMKRIGFLRMDESLRHILVKQDESVKIVDHFYAYTLMDIKPVKFFRQLYELGILECFLEKVKYLQNGIYEEWKALLPEYFIDTAQG